MLKGKTIWVTGAAGSIGSELVRQLAQDNTVLGIDLNEIELFRLFETCRDQGLRMVCLLGDVRDRSIFKKAAILAKNPDYIFHAAALKHVTPSSWWPDEYVKTNVLGTLNVIAAAKQQRAKLVNISTDKVVEATSMMGATKFVAEMAVRDAGYISVRFGNVLGSRGSVLEIWERQLAANQPLTITDERMQRYLMTVPEAVVLVIRAAEIGQPSQVLILDMGEPLSVKAIAERILKEKRATVGLKVIGMSVGEKLTETLMTDTEKARAKQVEQFWMIPPEWVGYTKGRDGKGTYTNVA